MDSMIEILRNVPLFSGVSHDKMQQIAGEARFHFLKYLEDETIMLPGQPATNVSIIISGAVRSTITNSDGRFSVAQTLGPNVVLAPSFLFGRTAVSPAKVVALEPTGIIQISKADYLKILTTDNVFLYNFVNLLAVNGQKAVEGILALTTGTVEQRLALWVVCLTQASATDITLTARHRDLYSIFGTQRSSFMAMLDSMARRGLITYTPREIRFLNRRALADSLYTTFGDADA